MNGFYWFVLGILAVWRITHLLGAEDGPWNVLAKLRELAGEGFLGKLLDCFYCLSLWVAAPFAFWLAQSWQHGLLLWLALSAAAILLERATGGLHQLPVAPYSEDSKENHNGMLQ
jgi:uncharacterized protein DUF1360